MEKEEKLELARRIRELREVCDYTQEQLAEELFIPLEVYRSYEESGENVPISVIYAIAKKFNVDFTEILTGTAAKLDTFHLVKAGTGKDVDRYPGYRYQDLAYKFNHKIMQPLLVTLDPSDEPAALVSHTGQEFNYCVSGKVIVVFDDKEFLLEPGDSIYFNPMHPHGQKCGGDEPGVFLTMIAE